MCAHFDSFDLRLASTYTHREREDNERKPVICCSFKQPVRIRVTNTHENAFYLRTLMQFGCQG